MDKRSSNILCSNDKQSTVGVRAPSFPAFSVLMFSVGYHKESTGVTRPKKNLNNVVEHRTYSKIQ